MIITNGELEGYRNYVEVLRYELQRRNDEYYEAKFKKEIALENLLRAEARYEEVLRTS